MTNKEWMLLISKEFNVSHTMAKGMLSAMYKAKKYLEIPKEIHKQITEEGIKRKQQIEEWEFQDMCDEEFMRR